MKLCLGIPLLLVLKSPWSEATRKMAAVAPLIDENTTVTKFYEPVAIYNDTRDPSELWISVNDSVVVYDTFGVMNGTGISPGTIEFAPVQDTVMMDSPIAFYVTDTNESVPLFGIPPNWRRGGTDNSTLVAVPGGMAPMLEDVPVMMLSTSPIDDIAAVTALPDSPIVMPVDSVTADEPVTIPLPLPVVPDPLLDIPMALFSSSKSLADFPSKPVWWDRLNATISELGQCKKRKNVAPLNGHNCQRKKKTCFFGNQVCPNDTLQHPDTMCTCQDKKWVCSPAPCP